MREFLRAGAAFVTNPPRGESSNAYGHAPTSICARQKSNGGTWHWKTRIFVPFGKWLGDEDVVMVPPPSQLRTAY